MCILLKLLLRKIKTLYIIAYMLQIDTVSFQVSK